ncbi:MAG: hypothetical protein AB7L91_19085 [Dehalococcoidia bacterium]
MGAPTFAAMGFDAERLLIAGKTGTGKSSLLLEAIAPNVDRLLYISPKRDTPSGWPVLVASEFMGQPSAAGFLAEQLTLAPRITVHFTSAPAGMRNTAEFYATQIDAVARAAFDHGNLLLVLDDVAMVVGTQPPGGLNDIVIAGRSRGVGFAGLTQRVHNIPRVFLDQATHVVAFRQQGKDDVDRLVRECHPDLAAASALGLPDTSRGERVGEFIWYDDRTTTVHLPKRLSRAA